MSQPNITDSPYRVVPERGGAGDANMAGMVEDSADEAANIAQARLLLETLWLQVDETSRKIEAAEGRSGRAPATPAGRSRRVSAAQLRSELYQVHRMIDRLNRRFPQLGAAVPRGGPRPT